MSQAGPISFRSPRICWGHVAKCTHVYPDLVKPLDDCPSQAEVDDHRLAAWPVVLIMTLAGLRVTVDDRVRVRPPARPRRACPPAPATWRCSRILIADQRRQRLALDIGYRQVKVPLDFPGVIDLAEVGVTESGGDASFFQEPSPRLGIFVITQVGYLQGHPAFEVGILSQINRAHPTLARPLDDPVPANF